MKIKNAFDIIERALPHYYETSPLEDAVKVIRSYIKGADKTASNKQIASAVQICPRCKGEAVRYDNVTEHWIECTACGGSGKLRN